MKKKLEYKPQLGQIICTSACEYEVRNLHETQDKIQVFRIHRNMSKTVVDGWHSWGLFQTTNITIDKNSGRRM